jgi:hypothetical protein
MPSFEEVRCKSFGVSTKVLYPFLNPVGNDGVFIMPKESIESYSSKKIKIKCYKSGIGTSFRNQEV